MTRLRYAACAFGLLLAVPSQAQTACTGAEAQDVVQGGTNTTIRFGTNPANNIPQELGQSFVASCNGELDFFRVLYRATDATSGGTTLSGNAILFEGAGTTGQTVSTAPFSFTLANNQDPERLEVPFTNAIVTEGATYTVFFDITSGGQVAELYGVSGSDAYTDGAMFSSNSGTPDGAGAPGLFDLTFRARFQPPTVASEEAAESRTVSILPTRPNPAVGRTLIPFTLREPADVRLAVYDALGREVALVADRGYGAGEHAETLDTAGLAPGTYVVRLAAGADVVLRTIAVAR